MTQTEEFLNEIIDAVMEAIHPATISREWIERFVRPIVEKYFSK